MTESPNDESINDAKRNEAKPKATPVFSKSLLTFSGVVVGILIVIGIHVSYGGLILFASKVAAANVLPTDINEPPYTDAKGTDAKGTDIKIPIFSFGVEHANKDEKGKPLPPNFDDMPDKTLNAILAANEKNKVIDGLRHYKNAPDTSNISNYFYSVAEALINLDYRLITYVLGVISMWSDWAVIVFGPIFVSISWLFVSIVSFLYFIYQLFAKMWWFFQRNKNVSGEGEPEWESVSMLQPLSVLWSLFTLWLCMIVIGVMSLFPPLAMIQYSIVPFTLLVCVFSILSYKAVSNERGTEKVTSMDAVKDVFAHYKKPIIIIYAIAVILAAFAIVGVVPGIAALVAVATIYFKTDIFNPVSEIVKLAPETDLKEIFVGGGPSITRKLKQMSKKLSRNNT